MKSLFKIYFTMPHQIKRLPLSEPAPLAKEEIAYIVAESLEQALEIFKMKRDETPFRVELVQGYLC